MTLDDLHTVSKHMRLSEPTTEISMKMGNKDIQQ